MATQPTNLPVPSESPRDLKFNAGKIDEFVTSLVNTYVDRLGNQHYTIEGLIRLVQEAIDAYGYITMDSFQDGATLTLPNQVLRWKLPDGNGEYYRWDGAFPKTVAPGSTPDTTGGIGSGAWLSVGDAILRGELASPTGAAMVGMCPDVVTLRSTEPTSPGQRITLWKAVANGPILMANLTFDENDSSTEDDGFSVFVTPGGKRWKTDNSNGYDVRMAGYNDDDANMSECLQKIIDKLVARVATDRKFYGTQMVIKVPGATNTGTVAKYAMKTHILMPTFITIKTTGHTVFDFTNAADAGVVGGGGFRIDNYMNGALPYNSITIDTFSGYGDNGYKPFDSDGGRIVIKGPGTNSSSDVSPGLYVGTAAGHSTTYPDIRDIVIEGLLITGFARGIEFGATNTYSLHFRDVHAEYNQYSIYTGLRTSGGEQISFETCMLSQAQVHHIYTNSFAFNLVFTDCHFDYTKGIVLQLGPNVANSHFEFTNCWLEGFRYVVYQSQRFAGQTNTIRFSGGTWVCNQYYSNGWDGARQLLFASGAPGTQGCYGARVDGVRVVYSTAPNGPTVMLGGISNGVAAGDSTDTMSQCEFLYFNTETVVNYPYTYRQTLTGNVTFSGTPGATYNPTGQPVEVRFSGGGTCVYGSPIASLNNLIPLEINMNSASDFVIIAMRGKVSTSQDTWVNSTLTIQPNTAVGAITVQAGIYNYKSVLSVSGSTVVATETATGNNFGNGTENVMSYLSATDSEGTTTTATAASYLGVIPVKCRQSSMTTDYEYTRPGIRITGFTGTIRVLLPAWWVS